tara:strand:+ start:518 stop:883 length:366 start_codon:yes stop_codon:yes gene_type:complete
MIVEINWPMKKLLLIAFIIVAGYAKAISFLPNCPSEPSARWHNCFGSSPMGDNGDKYSGEWKDDKEHGKGTYTWADGFEERGYFMNDEYVPTICKNMGLTKGTESFGQCVIRLIDKVNDDD